MINQQHIQVIKKTNRKEKEGKNMKIYDIEVFTDSKGKVIGSIEKHEVILHPYEYDKQYQNWTNCSGFYTVAQLRYRVKAGKIRWA